LFVPEPITEEQVMAIFAKSPRQISFALWHEDQPKKLKDHPDYGSFTLPFESTIQRIFEQDTRLELCENKNRKWWRAIESKTEFEFIQNWAKKQGTRIFLRDSLDLSIALDRNFRDNEGGQHTTLGQWELDAKHHQNPAAIGSLVAAYCNAISDLPLYRDCRLIAAVPAPSRKPFDLPRILAKKIAKSHGLEDLTDRFQFKVPKKSIKTLSYKEK
jgi:hypothetical protein